MFKGFKEDLTRLNGFELEILTVAMYQTLGYYTDSNLTWMEEKEGSSGSSGILEIDVLSKSYSPLKVTRVLTECKRGCDFNDYFKYLGICEFLKVDSKYLVCQSNHFSELHKLGLRNKMIVIKPNMLLSTFNIENSFKLNLLRGINTINISFTDKNVIANLLHNGKRFSREEQDAYNRIRKYLISLNGWIWKEDDPREKYNQLQLLMKNNKAFVITIAKDIGLTKDASENLMRDNPLCTAAGYVVLQAKMQYIVCAVECAIQSLISPNKDYMSRVDDTIFKQCVKKMEENIVFACKIPYFIQSWVNVFGGMLNNDEDEIELIATYLNERADTVIHLIQLLEEMFTLLSGNANIQWGFIEELGVKMFRYVPRELKAIGIQYRKRNSITIEDFCFSDDWERDLKVRLNIYNIGGII